MLLTRSSSEERVISAPVNANRQNELALPQLPVVAVDRPSEDESTAEPPLHWSGRGGHNVDTPLEQQQLQPLEQLQELSEQLQAELLAGGGETKEKKKAQGAAFPALRRRAAGIADDDFYDDTLQPQRPTRIMCRHCHQDIQNASDPSTVVATCDASHGHKFCQACVVKYVDDWLAGRAVYALRRGRRGSGRGLYALPCMLASRTTNGDANFCDKGCLEELTLQSALSPEMLNRYRAMIFQVRAENNKSRSLAEALGAGAARRSQGQQRSSQSLASASPSSTTATPQQSQSLPGAISRGVACRPPPPEIVEEMTKEMQESQNEIQQPRPPEVVMVVDPRRMEAEQQKQHHEQTEQSQLVLEMQRLQRELLRQQQPALSKEQQQMTEAELEEQQLLLLIKQTEDEPNAPRLLNCQCCFENVNPDADVLVFCNCRGDEEAHSFCAQCVRLYVEEWLFGGATYQLRPLLSSGGGDAQQQLLLLPCISGQCSQGVLENEQVHLALENRMMEQYEEKLVTCQERDSSNKSISNVQPGTGISGDTSSDDAAANAENNEEARLIQMAMRLSLEHEQKQAALREMALAQRQVSRDQAVEIGVPAEALASTSQGAVANTPSVRTRRAVPANAPAPVLLIYEQSLASTLSSLTTPNFVTSSQPLVPPQNVTISSPYQLQLPLDIPLPEPLPSAPDPLPAWATEKSKAAKLNAVELPPKVTSSDTTREDEEEDNEEELYERKRVEVEEAMTKAKVRECPTCQCKFLKDEEFCNKIKCPSCRTAMCYICRRGVPTKGYHHFCIHKTGGCGECGKCALWTKEADDLMRDEAEMRARGMDKANQIWAESLLEADAGDEMDSAPIGNDAPRRRSRGSEIRIDVDELLKKPESN